MTADKIPDDIIAAARGCAGRIHGLSMDVWETEKAVARAILAERERCVRRLRAFPEFGRHYSPAYFAEVLDEGEP